MNTRVAEAQRLLDANDDISATELCLRLWNGEDASALAHFVLPTLVARHEPARIAFTALRDALESRLDERIARLHWMQLSGALDDGLPLLRWLSTLDPRSEAARGIWSDDRIQCFVEKHAAWRTFARHLDIEELEEDLRSTLDRLAKHPASERKVLFEMWMEPYDVPRKTLTNADRAEDEARLAAIIDSFVV